MAARGGRKSALPLLAALLDPLIVRELATIGAIDSVMPRERNPGYVILLRAAKLGKQASVEQMATMIRLAGMQPAESAGPIEARIATSVNPRSASAAAMRTRARTARGSTRTNATPAATTMPASTE